MFEVLDFNGSRLAYYQWLTQTEPRGIVQLAHGMVEHLGRYAPLAEYLNTLGFHVVGTDHRGHGGSINEQIPAGAFGAGGWNQVVDDMHEVRYYTQRQFPDLPYFIIGHSMGSMLLRDYISRYGADLAGAAIIGTGMFPRGIGDVGLALAKVASALKPAAPGKLLDAMFFGSYNKKVQGTTPFAWLSRDATQVQKYVDDPLSGFVPTNAFYRELTTGLKKISTEPRMFQLRAQIPLFIASGDADPVGGKEAVEKLAQAYRNGGQLSVETHVYEGARHEIFNETNRGEVFEDLGKWLGRQVS